MTIPQFPNSATKSITFVSSPSSHGRSWQRLKEKLHLRPSKEPTTPTAAPDAASATQTQPQAPESRESAANHDEPDGQDKGSEEPPSASQNIGDVPIRELWNAAYEKLREEDGELVRQYESDLLPGSVAAALGSTLATKVSRREQMDVILKRKMDEVNRNTWKLKFGASEVPVRDVAEPVLGVVNWANDYVANAVSGNPYASIAWFGVSLLLPVRFALPEVGRE